MNNRIRILLTQLPTRLHFAAVGALACLAAAVLIELAFAGAGMADRLNDRGTRTLLFHTAPPRRSTPTSLKTGDIQLTLRWHNRNDLDLWCVDPFGETVWFKNTRSRSMGQLDIDMNAGVDLTDRPVENIFWPYDSAPAGSYEVYVNYFARHGDPDPTPYTVRTLVNGRVSNYAGSLEFGDEPNLVTTFNVPAGPWRFLGLRAGAWIAALVVGVWLAVCAAALTLGLNEGVRAWHRANDPGSVAPRRPTAPLRAALAAFLVGACCQLLYGTLAGWKPVLAGDARLVVWTLFGGIAAGLLHQWVPRLPAIVAVVAGALAAFASAAFFNGMPPGGDAPGRFFFATLWGFAIGLLIYLVRVPAPEPEIEELPSLQLEAMRLQPYRLTPGRLVGSGMRDG